MSKEVNFLSTISKQKYNRYKILYRGHVDTSKTKPHGFGVLLFRNDIYVGGFENGKKDGYGIWKCQAGYKQLSKLHRFRYFHHGIYIGYFKKNNFMKGKVIRYCPYQQTLIIEYFDRNKCIQELQRSENITTNVEKLQDSDYFRFESVGKQMIYGYCMDSNFFGNFINMNYHKNMHLFTQYENGSMNGLSIFVRLDNDKIVYKLITEWKEQVLSSIRCLVDDKNFIYDPISQIKHGDIPKELLCPIKIELMTQPYQNQYLQTYQFENIHKWMTLHTVCRDPMTNQILTDYSLDLNLSVQANVFDYIYETVCPISIQGTLCS